jgi:DNA gyrase/topoisomerase IV subunit A
LNINTIEEVGDSVKRNMIEFAKGTFGDRFPDVRDGLKVIARRLMYVMQVMQLTDHGRTIKNSKIIGSTIGDFHPHGDIAAYDAYVALAQPFTLNHPLVDPQGNFGNILGDSPAAARYPEGRFSEYGYQVLINDLNDEIVEYVPNYDSTTQEPTILPARLPNLIINGSYSIGGAAFISSIPPHNLIEVIDLTIKLIKDPTISNEILGDALLPDFPFGGIITNPTEIKNYYKYGTPARIKMECVYTIDTSARIIHITQLPYLVNANSVKDEILKKYPKLREIGIEEIILSCGGKSTNIKTDELDMDMAITYTKGTNPERLMLMLKTKTAITSAAPLVFSCIIKNRLIIDCTLKDIFTEWIAFRREVIRKSLMRNMQKIYREQHILIARINSYESIKDILMLAESIDNKSILIEKLIEIYHFSILQADAIANMKIYELSKHSKGELIERRNKLQEELHGYRTQLNDDAIDTMIIDDLTYLSKKFGRPRRTQIQMSYTVEPKHQTCKLIVARTQAMDMVSFINYDSLLKYKSIPRLSGITRSRYINDLYIYDSGTDYLFAISNYGNIYKLIDIERYIGTCISLSDKWETLAIKTTPRIGENVVGYCVIPKVNFEEGVGSIIIQSTDGFIRRLRVSVIPKRIPKNGTHIIDIKNTNHNMVHEVCGIYYLDPSKGLYIMYATHTGHLHLFPETKLRYGSKITGSVQATATGHTILNPQLINATDSCIMVRESASIYVGSLCGASKRSPGQAPDKIWARARRLTDPITFLGHYPTKGIFATSSEGDLEFLPIPIPDTFKTINKVSAVLII